MTSHWYTSEREYYAHEQEMELREQALGRHQRQQGELFPECPNCGSSSGTPVMFSYGISSENGYDDAGEGCTECLGGNN